MQAPAAFSAAGVQEYFPDARREVLNLVPGAPPSERFTIQLSPFNGQNNVQVARALSAQVPMAVSPDGVLTPTHFVNQTLSRSMERRVRNVLPLTATIEIWWTPGMEHPLMFCLDPHIDSRENPQIPHLYTVRHPSAGVNAICPYPPHYQLFNVKSNVGQYYLVYAISCWIANYLIWTKTGHWIGPEASHSAAYIQTHFADGVCWCRSGLPMAECHGAASQPRHGRAS